jgi:hypothetical protein
MDRHPPDDGLGEADDVPFDGFWQCQLIDVSLPRAHKPVTLARPRVPGLCLHLPRQSLARDTVCHRETLRFCDTKLKLSSVLPRGGDNRFSWLPQTRK